MKKLFTLFTVCGFISFAPALAQESMKAPALSPQIVNNLKSVRPATLLQKNSDIQNQSDNSINSFEIKKTITEAEGEEKLYYTESQSLVYDKYNDEEVKWEVVGASKITYGVDNQVYILNPVKSDITNSYIEGTLIDNKIVCELPQELSYKCFQTRDPETREPIDVET